MKLILASASPQRKKILSDLGYTFEQVSSFVDEQTAVVPYFSQLAFENALNKAKVVSQKYPDSLVIGADTVIEFNEQPIGKPSNLSDAIRILQMLSGKTHSVITAVALLREEDNLACVFGETTEVKMKALDTTLIEKYLSIVHVLDKAGAYAIQEEGDMIIESIRGSFSNVVGLPSEKLAIALKAHL